MKRFFVTLAISAMAAFCAFAQSPLLPTYPKEGDTSKDETLVLKELRTASDNIIVAFFTSDIVDVNGIDTSDPAQWTVNRKPAKAVYKFVTEADASEHHVYIELAKNLKKGKKYTVKSPYGKMKFRFNDKKTFCESIKTNQVGYSALSSVRYANFAIWLGDGGVRKIEGKLPKYTVYNEKGKKIAKGTLAEIGDDKSSGDYVYRIDLSSVPEGGPYTVSVKGYGVSYPFGVGAEFSKKVAWTSFRSLYYQRCGVPIVKPYAEWDIRLKPCHETIYLTYGPIAEARLQVTGNEPAIKAWGGYHDAGDADRRTYHMDVSSTLLTTYEMFPEFFKDDQFNIPDKFDENFNILGKGNGIPDILDEAEWGTMFWEYVQTATGEMPWGTETMGYSAFTTYDRDENLFGTEILHPTTAAWASALFVHLARLIEPYKPERAAELMEHAALARASLKGQAFPTFDMYYNVEMYLKTGEAQYHDYIKGHATDVMEIVNTYNVGTEGFARNAWLPSYFCSYIMTSTRDTDPKVKALFIEALKQTADKELGFLAGNAYPVGTPENLRWWGSNVAQGQYAYPMMLYWRLSGESKYIDGVSQLMDYVLGLNPMGKCFMTGVGYNRVHHPHDRESEYTNHEMGWGIRPGLIVFGPGLVTNAGKSYPAISRETPRERVYIDNLMAISQSEFTIYQSLCFPANIYPILTGGSEYDF